MINNGLYKYETHLHTSEGSACGASKAIDMVNYYKAAGYSGFVVTDHFFNGNTAIRNNLSWEKRVELFCAGYENAEKRGKKIDFDVFFGFEFNFRGTEFLIYGLDKEWLLYHPEILTLELLSALKMMRNAGGMTIHAHPFREAEYIDMIRLIPDYTDAVEVYNARNIFKGSRLNDNAAGYAEMYDKPRTTGGDIHSVSEPICAGIALKKRAAGISDIINAIKTSDCSLIWRDEVYSQFNRNVQHF